MSCPSRPLESSVGMRNSPLSRLSSTATSPGRSCRPAGAETAFSFAALADLLRPVLPEGLASLPSPQRRALSAALLLDDAEGAAPAERALALAVFQRLGAERRDP